MTPTPLRYRGHSNQYVDIAARGPEEFLGVSLEYAKHPSNVGCFLLRFVAHGAGVQPAQFKHLTYREEAQFLIAAVPSVSAEVFNGVRLNKIALRAFEPAVHRHEVDAFGEQLGIWPVLAAWITEQVITEGFTITVPKLEEILRTLVTPVQPSTVGPVTSILSFPKLESPEEQKAALKLVQKPVVTGLSGDDEDDEDGDDDDEKEWLN